MAQLTLPLSLPDDENFASFYVGDNRPLVAAIKQSITTTEPPIIYLWSNIGGGRSHLLHAACTQVTCQHRTVAYVPLAMSTQLTPAVLDGLEQLSLICIDDIDHIAGKPEWEIALFDLYNRVIEQGVSSLLITGNAAPKELKLALPDLASRLAWGHVYRVNPLSDNDKLHALQLRAKLRGFQLPEDVGRFLLKRLDRDMRTLFTTLDRLDHETIKAQRKITIPFVKEILAL